jgi:hypothetical protein
MLFTRSLNLGVLIALVSTIGLSAQAKDPRIGTWTLNVAKSTYPGAAPKSYTRTYEDRGGVIVYTGQGINADGNPTFGQTTYKLDGLDYPQSLRNAKSVPVISQKLTDPYTVDFVVKTDGKVTGGGTQTISKDGKTMTYRTRTGVVEVYEKQ